MNEWVLIGLGLAFLVLGAELIVRGASAMAARLGVSPLVVGLTIVAFGTSSPELAVSLSAVASDQPDLVLGNTVGSNTFNVLFILGISAMVRPLIVDQKLIRIDVPIMIATSVLLWVLLLDGILGRLDGVLLLVGIVAFTTLAIWMSRRESLAVVQEYTEAVALPKRRSVMLTLVMIALGLVGCVFGARWFVSGAVSIATSLGVSELVIGLTIVAAGTSLPEVATSLVAVIRGQRDIAVGNIIGSNIFNILCILGLSGVVAPRGVPVEPSLMAFDLPVMIAVAVACLPIIFTGFRITRLEGAMLFGAYVAYITFIVLVSIQHEDLDRFSTAMLWYVFPIAGFGVLMSVGHVFLTRRQAAVSDHFHANGGEE